MVLAILGTPELIIVAVVVLLLFGPTKFPQLGAGIAKMFRGFKKEVRAVDEEEVASRGALEGEVSGDRSKSAL